MLKNIFPTLTVKEYRELAKEISDLKNNPASILSNDSPAIPEKTDQLFFKYNEYQKALQRNKAFDFDDLIMQPIILFNTHPDIKQKYQEKFLYISIDEYQDINSAQYKLMQQLTTPETNLLVIGDPDQAIYGFRGSDRKFFLQFKKDFPDAKVFRLEKNYRSDSTILKASSQIIKKNSDHQQINIWSNFFSDTRIDIFQTPSEKSEAETIVHQIEKMVGATSFFSVDSGRAGENENDVDSGFSEIAVLYRTRAQLFALEEAFLRSGIPYQTFGDVPFYEIPEVKEIISFLKVIQNPHSEINLHRIINIPPRGIGEQTLNILMKYQKDNEISLWQAMERSHYIAVLSTTQKQPIEHFVKTVEHIQAKLPKIKIIELIELILNKFGFNSYFKNDKKRQHYWQEIKKKTESGEELNKFLERITLQKETDCFNPKAEKVALMTLHAAKGLEFSVVFIAGCEEGLIPFHKKKKPIDIEEERRLFYVGMTRAKRRLILLHAKSRFLFGERKSNPVSRFLNDIEQALKENRLAQIKDKQKPKAQPEDKSQMELF
ncbi:hypothetical protein B6I21_01030 [candidate division KSB1 bacterium 4572_119]|nr:MAG: hypothetical protein B6I21_01030 [candidate division KSB1 bacterium 4572_119]